MAKEFIGIRLPPELITALDVISLREIRSRANVVEMILTSWIMEHDPGLLPPKPPTTPAP